ncbi:hypothetical protein PF010_g31327 [Phytophthora fragariae]|uniref:HAT C-terminal dimerisation domain-containing protein n=2 Tax=Phytophthora fragariae TaxID=53985 RepID=A0A6A3D945_9STRA|nr:hypothetical protein PF009_g31731 [Phytophthora fragariae]KAE9057577.1 hypothetical protein PF010_g31327 [Phytophthora fragariae]KAE9060892.1 hypothetical protein PF006_g31538 [Phytophthora fragariae]KAE9161092.1 hypothetical protein PF004_g30953 [Phytophthora fragariae]KAE9163620.1 hypothetical protein PF002_g31808 [Phytophthora fragariae]
MQNANRDTHYQLRVVWSPLEEMQLTAAMEGLKECESVSKKLQTEEGLTLWDARILFDSLMELHPEMGSYLAPRAPIVKCPMFEAACVQALKGEILTRDNHTALCMLEVNPTSSQDREENRSSTTARKLGFAERALKRQKSVVNPVSRYPMVQYIPPTSNVVERLFSQAKVVLSPLRQSMSSAQLERVLFLKINRRFWSIETVVVASKQY